MIRWHLDPIAHGPLFRARMLADDGEGTKREAVGSAIVTRAQLDDLTARLVVTTPRNPQRDWLGRTPDEAEAEHTDFVNQILLATPDSWDDDAAATHIAVEYVRELERRVLAGGGSLERWLDEEESTTLPCARCGKPVPAGQATHADCQPAQCLFCTQCGKRLGTDERTAGARVCLVSCAPLADGIDGGSQVNDWWCPRCEMALIPERVTFEERCNDCGTPARLVPVELEPGESEGPDIATSPEQPPVPHLGPAPYLPGQDEATSSEPASGPFARYLRGESL